MIRKLCYLTTLLTVVGLVFLRFLFETSNSEQFDIPKMLDGDVAAELKDVFGNSIEEASYLGRSKIRSADVNSNWRDPRDWSDSTTIEESLELVDEKDGIWRRKRIVEAVGFDVPILLDEMILRSPWSDSEEIILLGSMVANQLVLFGSNALEVQEIEAAAEGLSWDVLDAHASDYTALIQADKVNLTTIDQALLKISELRELGMVVQAEPNYIYYATAKPANDRRYKKGAQWALNNSGGYDIDAPEGWSIRTDSSSVIIAITDTGIRLDHEDLSENIWKNPGEIPNNGRDDDENGFVDDYNGFNFVNHSGSPQDDNGHGTHVAGISGAVGNNSRGIAGVSWKASLMAVKSLDENGRGTSANSVEALYYAIANGANVINTSWGSYQSSNALTAAVKKAGEQNVLIVAASGNNGLSTDVIPHYPSSIKEWNVVSVGASDKSGDKASFSNFGRRSVDIFAPGEGIVSTWKQSGSAYTKLSGTSMAAPIVTGVLALNIAQFPSDSMQKQIDRLNASANKSDLLTPHSQFGGIVNLESSLSMTRVPYPPLIEPLSDLEFVAFEGKLAQLSIDATSDLPITYQWYFDGGILSGEIEATLALDSVALADSGNYKIVASNSDGSSSVVFKLTVYERMENLESALDSNIQLFVSNSDLWNVETDSSSKGGSHASNAQFDDGDKFEVRFLVEGPGLLALTYRFSEEGSHYARPVVEGAGGNYHIRAENNEWNDYRIGLYENRTYEISIGHDPRFGISSWSDGSFALDDLKGYAEGQIPPFITSHPKSRTIRQFERINLFSFSEGKELSYQWYHNGNSIEGANSTSLNISNASLSDAGYYYIEASNSHGTSRSQVAMVVVTDDPVPATILNNQESFLTVPVGEVVTLSHEVVGNPPIQYQWYRDDVPVLGAIEPDLKLGPLNMAMSGSYYLIVENEYSSGQPIKSAATGLYINEQLLPPRFEAFEDGMDIQNVEVGSLVFLYPASGTGSQPIEYQWFKDGDPIEGIIDGGPFGGPNSSQYTINVARIEDAGEYYLEARNSLGVAQSQRITLIVGVSRAESLDVPNMSVHGGSTNGSGTATGQTEVSWDGEDSVEITNNHEFQTPTFLSVNDTGPKNYRFYWKVDTLVPDELVLKIGNKVVATPTTEDEWQMVEFHIPQEFSGIQWWLNSTNGIRTAWVDNLTLIESPVVSNEIEHDFPAIGERVELIAEIAGENVFYQWYRNDAKIAGATSSELILSPFRISDAGSYRLEGSNASGSTSTKSVTIESSPALYTLFSEEIVFTIESSSAPDTKEVDENGKHVFTAYLGANESVAFKSNIDGPGVLIVEFEGRFTNTVFRVNGVSHSAPQSYEATSYAVPLPQGSVSVELLFSSDERVGRNDSIESYVKLFNIRKQTAPYLIDAATNYGVQLIQNGVNAPPFVVVAGLEPLEIEWFRDGDLVRVDTGLNSGKYVLYSEEITESHHGSYHCIVTDANGNTTQSEPMTIQFVAAFDEILEEANGFNQTYYKFQYDHVESKVGGSSVVFVGPFEDDPSRISVSGNYGSIWFKAEGFAPSSTFQMSDGWGQRKELVVTDDWQEVEIVGDEFGLSFYLPMTNSEAARFWIDGVNLADPPVIRSHPKQFATYLGADASFAVDAVSSNAIQYQWRKNGQVIDGEWGTSLVVEDVASSDLGEYDVVVVAGGESYFSESATLSLLNVDLGAAIGLPGLKVSTWGDALWHIDETVSVDGNQSLRSGLLENGQFSTIEWYIEGPISWGYYAKGKGSENDGVERQANWIFRSRLAVGLDEIGSGSVRVFDSENDFPGEENKAVGWIDGLVVSPLSIYSYEDWIGEPRNPSGSLSTFSQQSERNIDSDGDGILNGHEFALNLDPLAPDAIPRFNTHSVSVEKGEASLVYYLANTVDYAVSFEASFDMENWFVVSAKLEVLEQSLKYKKIEARLPMEAAGNEKVFVRWSLKELNLDSPSVSLFNE